MPIAGAESMWRNMPMFLVRFTGKIGICLYLSDQANLSCEGDILRMILLPNR